MEERLEGITIDIEDDFDLEKISNCGQCFRARHFKNGMYRFITGQYVLYIQKLDETHYAVSCTQEEWDEFWTNYFDLKRNYRELRERTKEGHPFVQKAMEAGRGLRILHQNAWEMLITFIISQRKNMPAIAKSVDALAVNYGTAILTKYETVYAFPTPEELAQATEEGLKECSLGYRVPYVKSAAELVLSGALDLDKIAGEEDETLFEELLKVYGVGKKVANCIALFGYGRTARVPIDVWIARVIEEEFEGKNLFEEYGQEAGIVQQYIFYYKTRRN
ncbi:MAG: DNA-3-methyladenine glycosylase family protein [Lachnospiraceae bacterium]